MPRQALLSAPLTLQAGEVHSLILEHYGAEGQNYDSKASELSSVFHVSIDATSYAFKAIRYSEAALAITKWRIRAMEHLRENGIPSGHTLPTTAGDTLAVADTSQGRVIVHMGEWLSGIPLEDTHPSSEVMWAVGRNAATIVNSLTDWPRPPEPITHTWELTRTLEAIDSSLPSIHGTRLHAVLASARDRFATRVHERLPLLPHSVIHHDLHDSNLLFDAHSAEVSGVLDFGDMVWGPRIAELAISAGYASRGATDPVAALLEVASGWGTIVRLTDDEVEVLFEAALGRIATNLAVWTARSDTERGAYAQARSSRSRRVLEAFLSADENHVHSELRHRLR